MFGCPLIKRNFEISMGIQARTLEIASGQNAAGFLLDLWWTSVGKNKDVA